MTPFLSVIIPAYNEAQNFHSGSLNEVISYLKSQKFSWEVLLVNDGSSDNTLQLLTQFAQAHPGVHVVNNPHQGKAATVTTGVLQAKGEVVLFTDMDQATPISEFDKFLPQLDKYDIIIGSRSGRKGAPLFRQVMALGMVIVRTVLLRLPFKDTQCGFKAFKSAPAKEIFSLSRRIHPPVVITGPAVNAGFDVELLYLARKRGYKILELPVTWQYRESRRVNFVRDVVVSLRELLLVRYRSLTGVYK